jgi:NAD(P)-dependent dehydrogenase (short-subunit alcohol dehydrogenase family)
MRRVAELGNLEGRIALITGAVGGLGSVFSDALSEKGADLILVDRDERKLEDLRVQLTKKWNNKISSYVCDLEIQEQRDQLISIVGREKQLNVLINNAAYVGTTNLPGWNVPFQEQSIETWRQAMEVNLTSIFSLCQGFSRLLEVSEGASIINISSMYGSFGPDWRLYEGTNMSNSAAYSASKGGLIQLTRWLSTTMAPAVRVNSISPGGIYRNQNADFVKRYEAKVPLKRMATEDDFRGVITFLASDLSKYVTGQNIPVDGGWGVW